MRGPRWPRPASRPTCLTRWWTCPGNRQDLFGWTVREGVTNVVRHSGATRCRIRVTPSEIEISDDGRGPAGRPVTARRKPRSQLRSRAG